MTEKIDKFRKIVQNRMIEKVLETGTPPMKHWPVPEIFKTNSSIMVGLLSKEGFELYLSMNDEEQKEAIEYIENCGPELTEILGCELFEDWDKDPLMFSDKKINELNQKYNLTLPLD